MSDRCEARLTDLPGAPVALEVVSPHVRLVLLPEHGADIHVLEDRRTGVDVLWKTPWGLRSTQATIAEADPITAWVDAYAGGWQLLTPSAGSPCRFRGVEHPYHGEACRASWSWQIEDSPDAATVVLATRLRRSPMSIERTVTLQHDEATVVVVDQLTNEGREPLEAMWTHHIVFGEPLVTAPCTLSSGARTLVADSGLDGPHNPLVPGTRHAWPRAQGRDGQPLDLGRLPAVTDRRQLLAYLGDFDAGWFTLANREIDLSVAVKWATTQMPYVWLWEDFQGSGGYPWYGSIRALGVEPASSAPAEGLASAVESGTHRVIEPGEHQSIKIKACFAPANQLQD